MNQFLTRCFFVASILLCGYAQNSQAAFSFSSRDSRLRFMDTSSAFVVTTPIPSFTGTLQALNAGTQCLQGTNITFIDANIESGALGNELKALANNVAYSFGTTQTLIMPGSARLRAETGLFLPAILAINTGNVIDGQATFSNTITVSNSTSELQLNLQCALNQSIVLNSGFITLNDTLRLQDSAVITGPGRVKFNNNSFNLPGRQSTWSTQLFMDDATDIQLHAKTILTSTWVFGPANGDSTLNGNGNILDMSGGATLWIRSGHGLALTDVHITGLGAAGGWFLFEDQNSTLSLENATLEFDNSMTITNGKIYVNGDHCNFITGGNTVQFALLATLSVDKVVLYYDALNTPDIQNIQPYPSNDISVAPSVNLLNGGLIRPSAAAASLSGGDLTITVTAYNLVRNEMLSDTRKLNLNGALNINTINVVGNGYYIQLPRHQNAVINIAAGKTGVFTDIVLKDLQPQHFSLGAASKLIFGASTTIELGTDIDVNMTWTFNGGTSRISGKGNVMNLISQYAILVNPSTTLQIQNTRVGNLNSTTAADINVLRGTSATSIIEFENSELVMTSDYTASSGVYTFDSRVCVAGPGSTFHWRSPNNMNIATEATLMFDRDTIFSYESQDATVGTRRTHLVMSDTSSRLYLNGCTLNSTTTGLSLSTGILVIDDKVTFSNAALNAGFGITLSSTMNVEVMAGATIDTYGFLSYV